MPRPGERKKLKVQVTYHVHPYFCIKSALPCFRFVFVIGVKGGEMNKNVEEQNKME